MPIGTEHPRRLEQDLTFRKSRKHCYHACVGCDDRVSALSTP